MRQLSPLQPSPPRQATQQGTERVPRERDALLQEELAPLSLLTTRLATYASPPYLYAVASAFRQVLLHTPRPLSIVALLAYEDVGSTVEATQNYVSSEPPWSPLTRTTDDLPLLKETHLLSRDHNRSKSALAQAQGVSVEKVAFYPPAREGRLAPRGPGRLS